MEPYTLVVAGWVLLTVLFLSSLGRRIWRVVYLSSKIDGPSLWEMLTVHAKNLLNGADMVAYSANISESFGYKPIGTWYLNGFFIFVSDCETAREVLKNKNTMDKATVPYEDFARFFGNGLLTMDGSDYARHRKIVALGLRKTLHRSFLPRLEKYMPEFMEDLRQKANTGKSFDPRALVVSHVVNLTMHSLTSEPTPELKTAMRSIPPCMDKATTLIDKKTLNPLNFWLFPKLKQSVRETETEAKKLMDTIGTEMAVFKSRTSTTSYGDTNMDFTQIVSRGYSKSEAHDVTCDEKRVQLPSVIVAGFGTTAYTVNVLLLVLAVEQNVQQRVLDEINLVLGDEERAIQVEDLDRMDYMERVIKETLRLFPAVGFLGRNVTEETQFKEFVAPKGSVVAINIFAIHRNPDNFPNPLKFDPDRFLPEASKGRHPLAFIPFSFGVRNCPGQFNASLTIKLILCHILRNFQILPGDNLKSLSDIKVKMIFNMDLLESSICLVERNQG